MERELTLVVKMVSASAVAGAKTLASALGSLKNVAGLATRAIRTFGVGLASLGRGIMSAATSFKSLVAAMAAFLAVRQVVGMLTSVNDQIDRMGELASEIGITSEALSGLAVAAQFGGSSMEELTIALRQLQKRSAASGDFRSLEVILGEVSDRLAATKNETERAALAAKYFGEEAGAKLINTLSGGSAALEGFNNQARQMGVLFSERTVRIATMLNDAIDSFRLSLSGLAASVIGQAGPSIIAFIESVTNFLNQNREKVAGFFSNLIDRLIRFAAFLADVFVFAVNDIDRVVDYIDARVEQLVLRLRMNITQMLIDITSAFEGNPLFNMDKSMYQLSEGAIDLVNRMKELEAQIHAIEGAFVSESEFQKRLEYIKSITGAVEEAKAEVKDTRTWIEKLRDAIEHTGKIMKDVGQGIREGFRQIKQEINDVAGNVSSAMTGAFGGMKGAAVEFFEAIYSGSMTAKEAFKQLIKNIVSQLINLAAQLTVIVGLALLLNVLLPGFGAALSGAGGVIGGAGGLAASMGSAESSAGSAPGSTAGEGVLVRQPGTNTFAPPSGSSGPINGAIIDANPPTSKAMVGRNSAGSGNIYIGQVQAMDAASFSAFVAKPENAKALRDQQNANLVKRDSTKRALP